jgi:hypothetical protein
LTKTAEAIIAEDDGASLCEHIVELIAEKGALQRAVDGGIEDYDLLLEGNKSLLDVHNDLQYCCEDLHVELAEVHSNAKKRIADLEAKVKTAEAHNIDIATVGKKCLKGFEDEHVRDLQSCAHCMCATLQLLEAYARPCLRASPRLRITFAGCPRKYLVSQICLVALTRISSLLRSKEPS